MIVTIDDCPYEINDVYVKYYGLRTHAAELVEVLDGCMYLRFYKEDTFAIIPVEDVRGIKTGTLGDFTC